MSELIFDFSPQNSPEWLAARLGKPTASCFDKIMASGRGGEKSKTRETYLLTLASERLTGVPEEGFTNAAMERGHAMEPEAREAFVSWRALCEAPVTLTQVGFVFCPDAQAGASPDSLVGDDEVLEIKTKKGPLQLALLKADEFPEEHKAQVQGQLWITRRTRAHFVSYWPNLPLFHKIVERDEPYIARLAQAVATFNEELNAEVRRFQGRG